jgi:hypothetical protein
VTSKLPGYATPAPTAVAERCAGCGERVSGADPGGYWMIDGAPRHTACVDWATRPFPYAWAVDAGERVARRHKREGTDDETLARALDWLRRAAKRWPSADPARLLTSAAKAAAVITAATSPARAMPRDNPPATLHPDAKRQRGG